MKNVVEYLIEKYIITWEIDNTLKDGILIQGTARRGYVNRANTRKAHIYTKGVLKKKIIPKPKEYRISELITLKLEPQRRTFDGSQMGNLKETNIYVNNKKFKQCKYLLLNLEVGKSYKEIESIDQAKELLEVRIDDIRDNYDRSMESSRNKFEILPEEEFHGHCSNIQAFYEYDYDLRVIHSNLGFPLLKELAKCGDQKAIIKLKEEITFRVEKGGFRAWKPHYNTLKYFTKEEREYLEKCVDKPLEKEKIKALSKEITLDDLEAELNYEEP